MKTIIENKSFGEERALYGLRNATVQKCSFSGEEDGESALKETRELEISECEFHLRYPLWHIEGFKMKDCELFDTARAPIWYARDGVISDSTVNSIKSLRESKRISFENCKIASEEFGWKCEDISLSSSSLSGAYAFLDCKNITIRNVDFKGKYSFQYVENLTVENSVLDTKDAFWHAKNVTVRNSIVKGEYLAWYSDSITFENCRIIGTQPLCYCKNLRLINCEMIDTDLSFENSEVNATINSDIISIKNPIGGEISCTGVGEIIFDEYAKEPRAKITITAPIK